MSLPHALLTALIEHPCSGSELASRFDRSIGYFWQATHQQIYRELGRLEQAGWIESLPAEGGRGRKRAWRVLPAGRKELKRWVAEREDPRPMRDALMVRLRAEAVVGPAGLQREIRHRLAQHEAQLALYRAIEARDFTQGQPTRAQQLQHLVLQAGITHEQQWVEFTRRALEVLARPAK